MANNNKGSGSSGGSKPSGGSSGGSKPSGGGSSGGSKPSGGGSSGGSKPSGGGSSGGSKPSGGGSSGNKPSSPAPSNPILAAINKPSGGGNSGGNKPSSGGSKNVSDNKVQKATEKIKGFIAGINESSPGIANPEAYKKALAVLKSAGKDTKVKNLKGQVQTAKTTAKVTAATTAATQAAEQKMAEKYKDSITKDELEGILGEYQPQTGITFEDMQAALDSQAQGLMSQFSSMQEQYQNAASDLQQQRADSSSASSSSTEDLNSQFEAFNPNLFTNLLGQLESSKYRQKEWNERSAKAAYKY